MTIAHYRYWPKHKSIPRGWTIETPAHSMGHHGRYSILIIRKIRKRKVAA